MNSRSLVSLVFLSLLAAAPIAIHAQTSVETATARRSRGMPATNAGGSASFTGQVSWSVNGSSVTMNSAGVYNSSAVATGPMRMTLFYSSSSYPASGTAVGIYEFPSIGAGQTVTNVGGTVPFSGANTCTYRAILLEERVGSSWEVDDWMTFISPCSLSPTSGPSTGGTSVTITGRDLMRVTSITFGGTAATINQKTETSITVTSPPRPPGNATVRLSDSNGSSSLSFTYQAPPPQIQNISPSSGPVAGGNNVTITGAELSTVTSVKFGGTAATISSKSASQIVVVAPPHAAGNVTVRVESPSGSATGSYRYDAPPGPVVTKISPASGPTAGNQVVTITGTNFSEVTSVSFGGSIAKINSKTATSIVVTTPAHGAGQVTVSVRSPNGNDSARYVYEDPQASRVLLLPVVGSLPGNLGSFFRTSGQFTNPSTAVMSGRIVFHPQGQAPSPADPSMAYTLQPGETKYLADILPVMNASGLGSLDLEPAVGNGVPESVLRIFNDGGDRGTTGMTIEFIESADALGQGNTGVLIAPSDASAFRFNIGVRALGEGASMTIVVRNAAGAPVRTLSKQFPLDSFTQNSAAVIVGGDLQPNDSISFTLTAGSAIVYGSTTDNITQDPTYQLAKRVPLFDSGTLVVPAAGSVAGNFNSFFRTASQMHNPLPSPIRARVTFHPQGRSGSDLDPSIIVTLAPGETRFFPDIVAALGAAGLGSLDVTPLDAALPVVISRIYNDAGANGTTGMTMDALPTDSAVRAGETAVLVAPANVADFRYNLGIRTLGSETVIQFTLRNAAGVVKKDVEASYARDFFTQLRAVDLFGTELEGNDSIIITVRSGAAVIYGATTDNRTQDPSAQMARAR